MTSTAVTEQLKGIWEEVLGAVPKPGDDFFEIGGNSLRAIQVVSIVNEVLAIEISATTLFEKPTFDKFSAYVQEVLYNYKTKAKSPLVKLDADEKRPNFFCVHPGGGNIVCYHDLGQAIKEKFSFYAFQSPSIVGIESPPTTFTEIAKLYVSCIKKVQPKGPYFLGGWSIGGVIAFEMSRQLEASKDEVHHLALIDSWAPSEALRLRIGLPDQHFVRFASDLKRISGIELDAPVRTGEQSDDELLQILFERVINKNVLPVETTAKQFEALFLAFKINNEGWWKYHPQKINCPVTLVRPKTRLSSVPKDETLGWGDYAPRMKVIFVEGDHYTMLQHPQIDAIAKKVFEPIASSIASSIYNKKSA